MRKTYSRSITNTIAKHQLHSPYSGFSYLCMNTMGTKLYANCMDSYIYCFDICSYDSEPGKFSTCFLILKKKKPNIYRLIPFLVAAFYGHENGSFYIKSSLSYNGNYLLSGSSDDCAYIWNTASAEYSETAIKPFVTLNSHFAEVTCVEMSADNMIVS